MPDSASLPRGAIFIHRLVSGVENVLEDIRVWNSRRRTAKALAKLDPHLLADIGLHDVDIGDFVRKHVGR